MRASNTSESRDISIFGLGYGPIFAEIVHIQRENVYKKCKMIEKLDFIRIKNLNTNSRGSWNPADSGGCCRIDENLGKINSSSFRIILCLIELTIESFGSKLTCGGIPSRSRSS